MNIEFIILIEYIIYICYKDYFRFGNKIKKYMLLLIRIKNVWYYVNNLKNKQLGFTYLFLLILLLWEKNYIT